ncbi:Mevalonyl-coenzyme A hydratase sidH [Cladobotryum mycophilum]|uniref:Mevalonyl-coenzyme A hydratase sidH n=1 Tax=Cladobotryum mycophilum TaxID=491253 RepID=A0ABR0SH54_9HYPO
MSSNFATPPPSVSEVAITLPSPHILLVTINRPKQLNSIRREMHFQLDSLWKWYDAEPSLRCAVITGAGRAFCAGADLKEWNDINAADSSSGQTESKFADGGFGGLSNRRGKKPIIAAVNGLCLGGGMEMVLNLDMVIASADAKFALPEVARGVVPIQGALPRLIRSVGMQRASEMSLLGRTYKADEMLQWGLVNHIVARDGSVVETALQWASEIANNSPDSIIVAREGLIGGWEPENPKASTDRIQQVLYHKMDGGENMKEGVLSFVEKRKPVWKDSKL